MIITLKSANFGASNIGTLDSYTISTALGAGAYWNGPTYVKKGGSLTGTIDLAEGYTVGDEGVTVTMGGNILTGVASINDNVITISIVNVTGAIEIVVSTTSSGDVPHSEIIQYKDKVPSAPAPGSSPEDRIGYLAWDDVSKTIILKKDAGSHGHFKMSDRVDSIYSISVTPHTTVGVSGLFYIYHESLDGKFTPYLNIRGATEGEPYTVTFDTPIDGYIYFNCFNIYAADLGGYPSEATITYRS